MRILAISAILLSAICASAQTYSIQATTTSPYVCGVNNTTLFNCPAIPVKNGTSGTLGSVWVHFYLTGTGPDYVIWTGTDLGQGSLSSASTCLSYADITSNGHTLIHACTRLYVWINGTRDSGAGYYGPGTINLAYHHNDGGGGAWGGGAGWRVGVTGGAFTIN